MYLMPNYIQRKFVDGMAGQRFSFSDKILLNTVNQTQKIDIEPQVDSVLKVLAKESFGVNARINLCVKGVCDTMASSQVGNYEVMLAKVQKGQKYKVELSYKNSIIQLPNFFTCPFIHLEVSMIPQKEVDQLQIAKQGCSR